MSMHLQDVYRARRDIAPFVRRTPLVRSRPLSERAGVDVHLKLECQQVTGAFKVRGAAAKLLSLGFEERARGVVTVSTGNHGRAVAHVASQLGIRAVICVSNLVPRHKLAAIEALGAELEVHGRSQDDAAVRADELAREQGLVPVPPFDDPHVIAGQATIGLEILEDLPEVGSAFVPLSGGGLLGGVAFALKSSGPHIRTVGVSSARSPVMVRSVEAGHPVVLPEEPSLADSLGGGIGEPNRHTLSLVRDRVDEHVRVDEWEIARAMTFAFREEGLVLEGAGATAIAALLSGKSHHTPGPIALVLSGANVDPDAWLEVVRG